MAKQRNLEIEYRERAWLKPFAQNPKDHSPEQVAQIRGAMEQWGWTIPILADDKGEVIAGHGRLLAAAIPPAIDAVPVIIAKGWTVAQKRAYRIADNKLTENGKWNDANLRLEIKALKMDKFDLELIGFPPEALADLSGAIKPLEGMPELPAGSKSDFEQITFTLHTSQVKKVREAMKLAEGMGPFTNSPNDNRNGNAIARVADHFLKGAKKQKEKSK